MQRYTIEIGEKSYVVEVNDEGGERYRVMVDGQAFDVQLTSSADAPAISTETETMTEAGTASAGGTQASGEGGAELRAKTELRAPMPGVVLSIAVRPGDRVRAAQPLLVLEAMKMKNPISAPGNGVVSEIMVQEGQSVAYDDVLLKFEEA